MKHTQTRNRKLSENSSTEESQLIQKDHHLDFYNQEYEQNQENFTKDQKGLPYPMLNN